MAAIPTSNGDNVTELATQANARKAQQAPQSLRITSEANSTLHDDTSLTTVDDPRYARRPVANLRHRGIPRLAAKIPAKRL